MTLKLLLMEFQQIYMEVIILLKGLGNCLRMLVKTLSQVLRLVQALLSAEMCFWESNKEITKKLLSMHHCYLSIRFLLKQH